MKNQIQKAKQFTMHSLGGLICQINPNTKPKQEKRKTKSNDKEDGIKSSRNLGIIKGISTGHTIRDLNKVFKKRREQYKQNRKGSPKSMA